MPTFLVPSSIVPLSAVSSPATTFRSTLLPPPEGPIRATDSWGATWRSMPWKIQRPSNCLPTFLSRIMRGPSLHGFEPGEKQVLDQELAIERSQGFLAGTGQTQGALDPKLACLGDGAVTLDGRFGVVNER